MRRFPPINDSEVPFCFWDLIYWKTKKRLWNINWHRWNWLAKINTKTSGRIRGGIFTSKKENSISNIDDVSFSKEKFQQQQLCKIIFHFHTNITNLLPKSKFRIFRLFFNSNKSAPFFYLINNFSKKATRFRFLFCTVPYFLARLQAPIITPQNTPFILRLNAKHFCSTTG